MSNTLKIALAGAAALVIAAIGIGLYFNQTGGIGPPAPSPSPSPSPTAVEIAQAYIEARNAYDHERARQLVADNFLTNEPPDGFIRATNFDLAFASHEAWGFHYAPRDDGCQQQPTSLPEVAVVACDYLWTTEVHRVSGQTPTPVTFSFSIGDAGITHVSHGADSAFFFGPGSFYDGFLAEHVDFRELVDESFNLEPEATREVIELLPEYFELYEEWLDQQRAP